jgi:hypothetical protein
MPTFRQFLEQISAQEFRAAQQAQEKEERNSPGARAQRTKDRQEEMRKAHKQALGKIREAQQKLFDKQKADREQQRANRQSGTDED